MREALFSVLGPPPEQTRVLDLFAGSGSLAMEALSRGAARAVLVESNRTALRCIRDNVASLGLEARSEVLFGDALRVLERLQRSGQQFEWVFLDPPYRSELGARVLALLGDGELLGAAATVILEHDRRRAPDARYGCLVRTDRRRYGDTEVSIYRREERMTRTSDLIAVYPGTFDPITNGHLDILERSLALFEGLIIAIATNPRKQPLFSVEERIEFIRKSVSTEHAEKLEFDAFHGLLVDYCKARGASVIVRGLRAMADFEYEFQFAHMNRRLAPGLDTVFFMTDERNHYVSSSLVKEVASFGGDISGLVPPCVQSALESRFAASPGDNS